MWTEEQILPLDTGTLKISWPGFQTRPSKRNTHLTSPGRSGEVAHIPTGTPTKSRAFNV